MRCEAYPFQLRQRGQMVVKRFIYGHQEIIQAIALVTKTLHLYSVRESSAVASFRSGIRTCLTK